MANLEIVFDRLIPMPLLTWKRPRVDTRGHSVRVYNEKKYTQAKASLGWEIKAAAPKLRCDPISRFGFRANFHLTSSRGGDGDRYENLVMDALQGLVWEDDNQVDEGQWVKSYNSANPGLWLTIWKLVP